MKVLGLITEYNPFHNGHLLHLEKSLKITNCDYVIAIMSGNFVQRGEPAIVNKYLRTKMALTLGVDMVIELPVFSATATAEVFAETSIKIMDSSKIITDVCFGSESGNLEGLKDIAKILVTEPDLFKKSLKSELKKGVSFPVAREKALENFELIDSSLIGSPNNILAIEYLKALLSINSNIKAHSIKRNFAEYHSKEIIGEIASASAIRKVIYENDINLVKKVVPKFCFEILKEEKPNYLENYSDIFCYLTRKLSAKSIENITSSREGFENRVLKYSYDFSSISEIIDSLKTKRYTYTKIQRDVLRIILNPENQDITQEPLYIRVLGFRKSSEFLLKELSNNSELPVIINLKHAEKILSKKAVQMLNLEINTTDIYNLGVKNNFPKNWEYKNPVIIV